MADAVLCEAMEYLSKLGSNLRSRSEILKEKKIRKDKLKNIHAVQKAASKVLLICELSKKSLENVETGVKNLLKSINVSQTSTSDGGNSSNHENQSSDKFQHFCYRSYKLKISKNVPVKHFMSVKVRSKRMPKSMCDKYPVYYDCKLYRLRKKLQRQQSRRSSSDRSDDKFRCDNQKYKESLLRDSDSETEIQRKIIKQGSIKPDSVSSEEIKSKDKRRNLDVSSDSERSKKQYEEKQQDSDLALSDLDSTNNKEKLCDLESLKCKSKESKDSELDSYEPDSLQKLSKDSDNDFRSSQKKQHMDNASSDSDSSKKQYKGKDYDSYGVKRKLRDKRRSSDHALTDSDMSRRDLNEEGPDFDHSSILCDDLAKKHTEGHDVGSLETKQKRNGLDFASSDSDRSKEKSMNKNCHDSLDIQSKEKQWDSDHASSDSERSRSLSIGKTHISDNPKIKSKENDSEPDSRRLDSKEDCDSKNSEGKSKTQDLDYVPSDNSTIKSKDKQDWESRSKEKQCNIDNAASDSNSTRNKSKQQDSDHASDTEKRKAKRSDSDQDSDQSDIPKIKRKEKFKTSKTNIKSDKTKKEKSRLKKRTRNNVIEYSSDSSDCGSVSKKHVNEDVIDLDSDGNNGIDSKSEKNIIDSDDNGSASKEKKLINSDDKEGFKGIDSESDSSDKRSTQADATKPLIKCVNINMLLKPDILQNDKKPMKSVLKEYENIGLSSKKSEHKSHVNNETNFTVKRDIVKSKRVRYQDEEEFWIPRRKQVQAFRPKNFCINVTRLPPLSIDFLLANKINKVIQNGNVICKATNKNRDKEVGSELSEGDSTAYTSEKHDIDLFDINTVKSALLIDSDSERSKHDIDLSDINTVKSALLIDSDSEKSENGLTDKGANDINKANNRLLKPESDNSEKLKNYGLDEIDNSKKKDPSAKQNQETNNDDSNKDKEEENHSGSAEVTVINSKSEKGNDETPEKENSKIQKENNEILNQETMNENPDKEKSPAVNNWSDSNSNSSVSKQIKKDRKTSKRKHIMESIHAKRMLLTYSSSSEIEDEDLNSVLKEVKESLLKGIGSDEENVTKKQRCKRFSSSDSDKDIKRVKKKRKIVRSKSSASEEVQDRNTESGNEQGSGDALQEKSNNSDQVDETTDDQSISSGSKMGRSREKPGSSSSHNSNTQDDKDIDGLTNLSTLNKQRRHDTRTEKAEGSSSKKMPKSPLITGPGLLDAAISSASASESDGIEEDLPPVTLSGLNGSEFGHMAKNDLLGDSDGSISSVENEAQDVKNEDESGKSDTEQSVKLKRRKVVAISSDSDNGSARRRKDRERKSDFEDSDDESEPIKKNKRKTVRVSGSEASDGSSNEGKKKRRRIKQIDSDDASGSDTENEGRNKHGRKNIRRVMGKNQLEEATKKAARQEKERVARIQERQKLYNNLDFDESGKPDEVVLEKVVLDFDPETKQPLIEVDRGLVKKLKPHQANGIKFMWDACFESVKRIKKDKGSGCILAHCMGLGKTLQVVSLTHTLLTHGDLTGVNRVLVVCPLSTVLNWVNEYRMWLKYADKDYEVDVYELSRYKQNSERAFQLSSWFSSGGVCVLGYEMFRNLSADNPKKFKKKMLKNFQESLVDPGPDLVVCDEGHLLKNEKTSLSQSMNRVKTHRRIVLTGTPLQNNLKEYYCMVQFVKPNLLGKYNEYLNRFVNPITNGQYTDSTEHDIRVMKRRSHVLHTMLDGAVQRRDYGVLAPFLPPKHEYVLFITLCEVQINLYQHYLDNYSRRPLAGKSSGFLFPDFQSLQRIWTHPLVLKYNSERYEIMQQKKRDKEEEDSEGSLVDFIDDDSTPDESSTEESSDDISDLSDDSTKKNKKKKSSKKNKAKDSKASTRRGTRANPTQLDDDEVQNESDMLPDVKNDNPTEWWIPLTTDESLEDIHNSHKLVLLFEILRQCEAIGDKLLVFSQSLYSLDLIEHFLGKVDEATQEGRIDEKLGGHVGSWSPGIDYFRLDGSTSCENRSIWCKNFNREDNPRARLFLISTRAGGLGINLVAANRVVIFDVSWNPSHDVQSIFRVYRFGQKKPCYIYRFLAMGTMEEKIYERQVTKQAISKRVIDEQQIDRHYAENDLAELYKFEPRPPAPRPVPLVPKDRLFAEMLKDHDALIYKFHEHDSLLENKEEETLTEEERKAAWDDFENEKNRPPPVPFTSPWSMSNGMAGLLAQQQQQLAYSALATMLRKDMPNLSDDQIRSMLPLIYGANPGLMQKLSDIYKYPQPNMMNPAMMNPVMNPGGLPMGGGTSGLQYEPPWAREQQHQQMRLQQLMQQQQNQMGAKYYAGGLGSRDPVAMALQQQRAREIMLGDRGRPRGRPPLQPRLPPVLPADVVNLDSD